MSSEENFKELNSVSVRSIFYYSEKGSRKNGHLSLCSLESTELKNQHLEALQKVSMDKRTWNILFFGVSWKYLSSSEAKYTQPSPLMEFCVEVQSLLVLSMLH